MLNFFILFRIMYLAQITTLIEYLCKCGLKNSDICTAYRENKGVNHFLLTCPQLLSMKD